MLGRQGLVGRLELDGEPPAEGMGQHPAVRILDESVEHVVRGFHDFTDQAFEPQKIQRQDGIPAAGRQVGGQSDTPVAVFAKQGPRYDLTG